MFSIKDQTTDKGKPWPAYFLVRKTGEVVPLIAADELPPGTDLVGIPRSLGLEETIGMLNLGIQRSSGTFYQLAKSDDNKNVSGDLPIRTKIKEEPKSSEVRKSGQPRALGYSTTHTHPNIPTGPQALTRLTPPQVETQICRHWCTHGICKWGQQCRYRHIMPMTLSGLQEVGLTDWPKWYRSLNPGYFSSESRGMRQRGRGCTGVGCCGGGHLARGRGVRGPKREEVEGGEKILERLRDLPKDAGKGVKAAEKQPAAKRDIGQSKDWEEDTSCSEASEEAEAEGNGKGKTVKGKLVDV